MPYISLKNLKENYIDEVYLEKIDNKAFFSYLDNEKNTINIEVFDDGIILKKTNFDSKIILNLLKDAYVIVSTLEGDIKINAKVVEFQNSSDILLMRYLLEGEERVIEVKY